ncbi:MAG: hypothetical protein FJ404_16800, partial [Verrucomicrobia bacterium]|nr:hypothetical protein [Verrucomicrobiota bacterium]
KPEHFAVRRIDWNSKSESLQSIAEQLGFTTSSLVFIDDDPVQCAEVRARWPEILTLQLPANAHKALCFLEQVWELDAPLTSTLEDDHRQQFLMEETRRQASRHAASSLEDFLAGLDLQIEIGPLKPEHRERVSQLSYRTTQSNSSNQRLTARELDGWIENSTQGGRVVHVRDRFGDYGLVGVMLYRETAPSLDIESLMLSCRALGRGVEQAMLQCLAQHARDCGLEKLRFKFQSTARNKPASDFLHAYVAKDTATNGHITFEVASALQPPRGRVQTNPPISKTPDVVATAQHPQEQAVPPYPSFAWPLVDSEESHQRACLSVERIESWRRTLRERRQSQISKPLPGSSVADVEAVLTGIWSTLMRTDQIGRHDNFFELGGHSLTVIQCLCRIRDQLGVEVPIQAIFKTPTIAELSATLRAMMERRASAPISTTPSHPVLETFTAPTPSRSQPASISKTLSADRITTLAIPTRGRPDALLRGLPTFVENARQHGHTPRYVILDDATTTAERAQCQAALVELERRLDVQLHYVDDAARRHFAAQLSRRTSVPLETVQFGLLSQPHAEYSRGACVNAMLLSSPGERILSVDDDVLCRPSRPPSWTDSIRLGKSPYPEAFWPCGDVDSALAFAKDGSLDFIGLVDEYLGRTTAEMVTQNPYLAERLDGPQDGRVLMATPGIAGDPGWGLPFGWWDGPMGYLMMEGESFGRLTRSREDYRAFCCSRSLVRCAEAPTLTRFRAHLTTTLGLDHRGTGLPPFLPCLRGEDVLFGALIRRSHASDWAMHLPWLTPHLRMQPRTFQHGELFRSASSHDAARLFLDCLNAAPADSHLQDPTARCRRLGEFLMEIASSDRADFVSFATSQALQSRGGWLEAMRARLEANPDAPSFWAQDMHRYMQVCESYLTDPMFGIPMDLLRDVPDPEAAWDEAQTLVRRFGDLLVHWGTLVSESQKMRGEGIELARPLSEIRARKRRQNRNSDGAL